MTRSLLRWTYPWLMLIGFNGLAIVAITRGAPHVVLAGLLIVAIGVSFAVERLIPYEPDWNLPHDDVDRDVLHALVNETLALGSVIALPGLARVATITDVWPHHLPFVVQVLGTVLVFDFGITVAHWLSHRWGPLWRLHAVHHSVKRAYGFNGLMKHPLHQAVELSFGVGPLLVIGLPQEVAWALAFAVAVQLLMQHSNADYRVGALRGWLSLNEGHRFHHLKWAGVGDVNFGLFTLIYDRLLLKTFSYNPAKRFTSDDLGIGKQPDFPAGYRQQLAAPFRTQRPSQG
ncbi:MAG TPA: sterol desaturase family protein [Solirubrobacteraceae bacterium]|nr:sterol desaturase family protein [Solirubrobacteraceae bacterium]